MVLLGAVSALLIAAVLGAACYMWLATASQVRRRARSASRPGPDAALRRHPAGRGRYAALVPGEQGGPARAQAPGFVGPDDDPEFISSLQRLIHGGNEDTQP